jgi:hypothetical protein
MNSTTFARVSADTRGSGLGFVDIESTIPVLGAVELLDGRFRLAVVFHLDETKTPAPARLAVDEDLRGLDDSEAFEQFSKLVRSHSKRKISDIEPLGHRTDPIAKSGVISTH